jgi:hypothetical protein
MYHAITLLQVRPLCMIGLYEKEVEAIMEQPSNLAAVFRLEKYNLSHFLQANFILAPKESGKCAQKL